MQVYKTFILSMQCKCANCTKVYEVAIFKNLKEFQKLACSFPFFKDERHFSHTLLDHTLIQFIFITSYMFIPLATRIMMNMNQN